MTIKLLPEYLDLLADGELKVFIDDPTTRRGDGFARALVGHGRNGRGSGARAGGQASARVQTRPAPGARHTRRPRGAGRRQRGLGARPVGSSGGSGSSSSSGGGSGSGGDTPPPLSGGDGQYDPANNDGDAQIPTGCENENSECAACVRRHESAIAFNRRYLHVAWSTAHDMIIKANRAIAVGDTASGMHATQGLAWQLGGKPQIVEALHDLRLHYRQKAKIYLDHIQGSVQALAQCEADNFAIRDLYARFGNMYVEFLRARYESAD